MSLPEKKLGPLLFLVSRAHNNQASQVFEQLGLHRGQPPVLFEIGRQDGITQSELAEKMEVTPATITNMLRRMQTSGFIVRARDPADTRVSRVLPDRERKRSAGAGESPGRRNGQDGFRRILTRGTRKDERFSRTNRRQPYPMNLTNLYFDGCLL